MRKPTICIGENKDADQLRGNREADQRLCFRFATRIVQFLFYLNPEFQASSSFLCLYSPVCVGAVRKPHCWFSHEAAHFIGNHSKCFDQIFSFIPLLSFYIFSIESGISMSCLLEYHYFKYNEIKLN